MQSQMPHYSGEYLGGDEEEPKGSGPDLAEIFNRVTKILALFVPYWPMAIAFIFLGIVAGAVSYNMFPPPQTAIMQIFLHKGREGRGTDNSLLGARQHRWCKPNNILPW